MINKDISVNSYQKCFIFYSKVLLAKRCSAIWAYNFCYHGNILGSRPPRYKRLFWPLEAFYTVYCQWCVICMIQQAFKYIRLSSWPCFMSSKLRTTKILKSGWRDWKRVGCHGNGSRKGCGCVAFRTIGLPSFNDFCCKLTKIGLFIYLMYYLVECMMSSVISFAYFSHFSNLYLQNQCRYL